MRKSLILSLACLMALSAMAQVQLREDEVTAVKFEQGQTTDWYMLSTKPKVTFDQDFNPVINNNTTYDLALGKVRTTFGIPVIETWETIREGLSVGEYGTVCLPRTVTEFKGAIFYEVIQFMSDVKTEEVKTLQAGKGYIFQATESTVQVKYTGEPVAEPVMVTMGLQGTFVAIQDGAAGTAGNVLEGNYILYNNQFRKCAGACTLSPYRAYLLKERFSAEGIGDLIIDVVEEPITSLSDVKWQAVPGVKKVLMDGILYILRDSRVYNAQGIKIQ